MKKPVNLLVVLTCVFAAFLGGFHLGRRLNRSPVHIYQATAPADSDPVPPENETEPETQPAVTGPLNINTATAQQLDDLPGIGPVLAQRIVDYRTAHGGFSAVEELLNVSGIGNAKLMEILDEITVEQGGS